ncbi:hypothetical protein ZIOFF_039545 [Zingiber officinale]|uniref:Deoxyuridine 5'-triphosphate nucleotidohydrolase n=1 Tax=Zingiber officinale TaxID=94328 RepID=A0A8J5GBX0_ZINOF|nr:hypothetical protein ZIOFF_039545 [Zingiber officinale]
MNGRISISFNNYLASSSAQIASYNSKDEEIQSDEETFHTLAVLVGQTLDDPTYGEGDDYYEPIQDTETQPSVLRKISNGISLEIPYGSYGRIATRSSTAWNLGLDVRDGVIDIDYRREIIILSFNHSDEPIRIQLGDTSLEASVLRSIDPALEKPKDADDFVSQLQYMALITTPTISADQQIWNTYSDNEEEWLNPFTTEGGGENTQSSSQLLATGCESGLGVKLARIWEL